MENFFTGCGLIIFGAFLSLFIKNQGLKIKLTSIFIVLGSILTFISAIGAMLIKTPEFVLNTGSVFQNIRFEIDYLSAFFVIFISIMSALAAVYANGYLAPYIKKGKDISSHCLFLSCLIASMLLVVSTKNALAFLIVWELMSLSSFFLVIFENDKKDVLKAGIKYLVFMHISVIFIILLFALLSINTSSLDFANYREFLNINPNFSNLVFMLAFIGFGIKAGFVPFHNWLPSAHPAAPSHVSAVMSGVMIKTGIYGILRVLTFISHPDEKIGYFVLIISAVSALYGVLYAICQHDLKRLLAYHSIENIGIIGIGLGIGMLGLSYNNPAVAILGFSGGILHILNHSIFKELLFLAAGSVYNKTHTRNIEILGGLIKSMPKTAVLFLIGSIAICALPPFNGFISEFLIYFGMLKGLAINSIFAFIVIILTIASLALVGTMAILCFTKAFSIVFLGEGRSENALNVKEDTTISFSAPMLILALASLMIGLFPKEVFTFISYPVSLFTSEFVIKEQMLETLSVISFTAFSVIGLSLILFFIKKIFYKKYSKHQTWGCGYNRISPKMQYSASSYASPFLNMLKPLFKRVADIKKPKTIFQKDAHYNMHLEDVEEAYFLTPFIKALEKFFAKFEKIQNGNIQNYIMYGLIFLVLSLIGVVILG